VGGRAVLYVPGVHASGNYDPLLSGLRAIWRRKVTASSLSNCQI
jgi:hypothetical protein